MTDFSNENVIHIKDNGLEYIQCRKLLEYKDKIVHCYTTRDIGKDYKQDNGENYKKLYESLGLDINKKVRIEHQIHSDKIENVKNVEIPKYNKTNLKTINMNESNIHISNIDGLVSNEKGVSLMLRYADCTPILLYDTKKNIIGNVHSGWRGTVQKIGQKAVLKMVKDYNSNPEDIICFLGPAIQKCHFEVDEDVKEIFENTFSYLYKVKQTTNKCDIIEKGKIENGKQKYQIDTTLINRFILEEVGIKAENIIESKICTACYPNQFHSYRIYKEKSGRNIAVIGLL